MKRLSVLLFLYLSIGVNAWALDVEEFFATGIDVTDKEITLYSQEPIIFGFGCKGGAVGILTGLKTIRIGDVIRNDRYSFRVGIIQVARFNKDMSSEGSPGVKKGDVICLVAESEDALPSNKQCDALWLRIVNCRPLK